MKSSRAHVIDFSKMFQNCCVPWGDREAWLQQCSRIGLSVSAPVLSCMFIAQANLPEAFLVHHPLHTAKRQTPPDQLKSEEYHHEKRFGRCQDPNCL